MLPPKDKLDAREPFVTPLPAMLIAAIAVWLALVLVSIACFRVSAAADSRDLALNARYPTASGGERYLASARPGGGALPGEDQPVPTHEPGRPSPGTGRVLGI
jgi:hypothetical protein